MTHKLVPENPKKIKKAIPLIESKTKVKINFFRGTVSIEGNEINEYLVEKVLKAVDFGFDPEDALLLLKEQFNLSFINLKDHTHRKNMKEIRARVVGKGGKAKRTIEELTGGIIVLNANTAGIIVDNDHLSQALQGLTSLIQGSKHGNVFAYLEKQNANLNKSLRDSDDLGLRDSMKKYQN